MPLLPLHILPYLLPPFYPNHIYILAHSLSHGCLLHISPCLHRTCDSFLFKFLPSCSSLSSHCDVWRAAPLFQSSCQQRITSPAAAAMVHLHTYFYSRFGLPRAPHQFPCCMQCRATPLTLGPTTLSQQPPVVSCCTISPN